MDSLETIQSLHSYWAKTICTQISTTVYSQVLIHTAEWTGGMYSEKRGQGFTWQHMIWTQILLVESLKLSEFVPLQEPYYFKETFHKIAVSPICLHSTVNNCFRATIRAIHWLNIETVKTVWGLLSIPPLYYLNLVLKKHYYHKMKGRKGVWSLYLWICQTSTKLHNDTKINL